MMPIVTWDHVHLRSPDPEATAAWLENILGGVIIRGPGRIDVKLGGANVFIAPVAAGDGVNSPPATPYQGLDHFGLTVKDIDAVAAEIKAKGVAFTKEPTTIRPGVRLLHPGAAGYLDRATRARQEVCVRKVAATARCDLADERQTGGLADRSAVKPALYRGVNNAEPAPARRG
jgi:lactoylglutathione lyase